MKKILYISTNGYLGGAERAHIDLAKTQSEYQKVMLFLNGGQAVEYSKRTSLETYHWNSNFRFSRPLSLLKVILKLRKFIKDQKPNYIHSCMPYSHIIATFASLGLEAKRIWFQHGPINSIFDKIAARLPCNQIWFNSHYLMNEHEKLHPNKLFNKSTHHIVNLGISVPSANEKIESQKKVILLAGRICEWKGQHLFLEMFSKLDETIKDKFEVLVLGEAKRKSDIQYFEKLKSYKESNIHFLGHIDNISKYYHAAELLIHTSTIPEPFGLVVAEAMLCNTFVIGSNQGGVTDLITNEKTGLSFDPTNPSELKSTFEKYLNLREDKKDEIKKSAHKLIITNYSLEQLGKRANKLTQQCV